MTKRVPSDIKTLTRQAAQQWPDRIALTFDHSRENVSFRQVHSRSNAIANALLEIGVRAGDHIAVLLHNQAEFPLTWLALAKIGAVMVPVNVFFRESDAGYVLKHSESRLLVTKTEFLPLVSGMRRLEITLPDVVLVDGSNSDHANLSDLADKAGDHEPSIDVFPETILNIQYTSGTTGHPKGCLLSQRYWMHVVQNQTSAIVPFRDDDIMVTALPFYYVDPQWQVLAALLTGAQLVVLDRFHPSTFWQKVREYRGTFFYCLGMMPTLLLKMPPDRDDRNHRVRAVLCSGIPKHLQEELETRWGAPWYEGYGLTETGPDAQVTSDDHDELVGTGSIGRPGPFRDVRVVDDEGRPVPRGEAGELLERGVGMMDGYFKDTTATEDVFRGGWFHTGDLVRQDSEGRLYYLGRKKEMIRRSGENISAEEVEDVLKLHPAVKMAACVPVRDELRGEEVKAFIVLQPGYDQQSGSPEILAAYCLDRLAYFKVPRYWTYREELQLTPSERVSKAQLRQEGDAALVGTYDRIERIQR